jgi:hypothetical protein
VVPTSWAFDLLSLYNNADRAQGDTLTALFTKHETKATVKGMNAASAPGSDDIGLSFYASAWETTKHVVMEFLYAFMLTAWTWTASTVQSSSSS